MNPYLAALRNRYSEMRSEAEAIQTRAVDAGRDLTDDEQSTIGDLTDRCRSIYPEIEALDEEEQRHRSVAAMAASLGGGGDGPVSLGGGGDGMALGRGVGGPVLPTLAPSIEHVRAVFAAVQRGEKVRVQTGVPLPEHLRAVVSTEDTGLPVDPGTSRPARFRRLAEAASMPLGSLTGIREVRWPVFGPGAAATAPEGTTKQEYDNISGGTAQAETIAVWTDYTRQQAESWSTFEAALINKHAALIARREERLVIETVLATSGIGSYTAETGDDYADSLLEAAARIMAGEAAADPNLAVVNAADVRRIFGGGTGTYGESPQAQMRLQLHGMTLYPSEYVDEGTALVGAWPVASRFLVSSGLEVRADPYSGLKQNTVTVLSEETVAAVVDEPAGFVEVDLTGEGNGGGDG